MANADSSSTQSWTYKLDSPLCIEIQGEDAARVLNNLCTADIAKLPADECCEGFVTDIRGRVVAHVVCLRTAGGVQIFGQHDDSPAVAAHVDRYIIREDAAVSDNSAAMALLAVSDIAGLASAGLIASSQPTAAVPFRAAIEFELSGVSVSILPAPIAGATSAIACCPVESVGELEARFAAAGCLVATAEQFELARIRSFWPRSGREIQEKTLPQELDRDSLAISFTKGCYLGQETVARLDARGQLQKKLCLVKIEGAVGESDVLMDSEAAQVGKIYSAAFDATTGNTLALANMRRGNFEPGKQARYLEQQSTVLGLPEWFS